MYNPFLLIALQVYFTGSGQAGSQLDSVIRQFTNTNIFHGSLLVSTAGKIILENGYGFQNISEKKLNEPATIYQGRCVDPASERTGYQGRENKIKFFIAEIQLNIYG